MLPSSYTCAAVIVFPSFLRRLRFDRRCRARAPPSPVNYWIDSLIHCASLPLSPHVAFVFVVFAVVVCVTPVVLVIPVVAVSVVFPVLCLLCFILPYLQYLLPRLLLPLPVVSVAFCCCVFAFAVSVVHVVCGVFVVSINLPSLPSPWLRFA